MIASLAGLPLAVQLLVAAGIFLSLTAAGASRVLRAIAVLLHALHGPGKPKGGKPKATKPKGPTPPKPKPLRKRAKLPDDDGDVDEAA